MHAHHYKEKSRKELTGRELTWQEETTTIVKVSTVLLITLKPSSLSPTVCYF